MSVDLVISTATSTAVPMNINDNGTLGTPVSLPLATTSDAGLMSATDKAAIDNSIQQGGNSFAAPVVIGTNDNNQVKFKVNTAIVSAIDAAGDYLGAGIKNFTTSTYSQVLTGSTGTYISRDIADDKPALIVDQLNASSTGAIQEWRFNNTSPKSYIKPDGSFKADHGLNGTTIRVDAPNSNFIITASTVNWSRGMLFRNSTDSTYIGGFGLYGTGGSCYVYGWMGDAFNNATLKFNNTGIGIKLSGTTAPSYRLHLDIGTVTGANVLGYFGQNSGSLQIKNGSSSASEFNPTIVGTASNVSDVGLGLTAQGSDTYSTGAFYLNALDAAGTGPVTGDNTFQLANNGTSQLTVDYSGVVTIPNLAGSGVRMVVADSTGALSATAEVSSGTYTPNATMTPTGIAVPHGFTFIRGGNVVTVNGMLDYNGATAGTSIIEIDIPIASTFTANENLVGVVTGDGLTAASPNYVIGNTGSNTAHINFSSASGGGKVFVQFQYQVL